MAPKITHISFNTIEVNGHLYQDVRLLPNKVEIWERNFVPTPFGESILLADLQPLFNAECSYIILSCGFNRTLDVNFDIYKALLKTNVDFKITDTLSAIGFYRELIEEDLHTVGALIYTGQ
jgi:hypothetical protein